jgi:hypothetical protein
MKIVDHRSDDERNNEQRAQSALDEADEKIAQNLAALTRQLETLDYRTDLYKELCKQVREIGEFLCSHGGSDRMDLICYRVAVLAVTSQHCRRNWSGVCGWMY